MAVLPNIDDLGGRPVPVSRRNVAVVRNAGAVGQGLEQVGGVIAQAGDQLHQLDQRRQAAQAGVDFAKMAEAISLEVNQARTDAPPGAGGHMERVTGAVDQRINGFLETIRDPVVRENFRANTAQLRARTIVGEDGWAIEQRRELALSNVEESGRLLRNQLYSNPSPETLQNYFDVTRSTVMGQEGLPAAAAEVAIREQHAGLARSYIEGLIETNPEGARRILESGVLNQYFGDRDLPRLVNNADTAITARQAELRRQQTQARAEARTSIELLKSRIQNHDPTITDEELEQAETLARGAGLPAQEYDISVARDQLAIDRTFRTATGQEISEAIREYDARIAQGGENASPSDVIRRERLQSLLSARQQQDQNDPLSSYAQRGGRIAPVNFADPGTVRARLQAARTAQSQTGYFSFFTPQETALYRERVNSGPEGRLAVANEIASMVGIDADAALRTAEQVAPDDGAFRQAIRLSQGVRVMVLRGTVARQSIPQRVVMADGSSTTFDTASQSWFAANITPLLANADPEFVSDTLEAARAIYAERLLASGGTGARNPEEFSEPNFRAAVHFALGGTGRNGGGIGQYSYGPRRPDGSAPSVILPARMRQEEFDRRIAALPTHPSQVGVWNRAVNGAPVWSDGRPMSTTDLRRRFVPIAVSDGVYQFEWNGQTVVTRRGEPFRLDIRRVVPQSNPQGVSGSGVVAGPGARRAPTPVRPALPQPRTDLPQGPVWRGN